ncbi:MAG: trypsin-like peptidase domain-containing protein [Terriglobales bacterium]
MAPEPSEVIARVGAATVLVLSGEGAGRLSSISTGVIVRPNGVLLTAYHAVKDAREVQVRLKTGDIYDQAVLIGADERRDVAALKIAATNLPTLPLGSSAGAKPGEPAYVVSNSNGLAWSASSGIFSASRLADEIPGAGQGFTVLQFTAMVSGGASGGPLVDSRGALVGIITKGVASGTVGFAVPIEAVIGLADGNMNLALGSGAALQMPSNRQSPSSAAVASSNLQEILRAAKTICISTRTMYFTPARLERELVQQKDFENLGLLLVKDPRVADLLINIDRPSLTYTFTYSVVDSKTSLVLDSGKVTAIDGNAAAGKIAKQLVSNWANIRRVAPVSKSN